VWENEEEEEGGKGGDDHDEGDDGTKSMGGRSMMSHAPSLHPSMAGSVVSMACSEVTIGAGDNTGYWDYLHRKTIKADLGHTCRECKLPFNALNEPITERRGARTSLRYHAECFSGFADPRSQASSSMHTGNLRGTQFEAAPRSKAGSKMRASKVRGVRVAKDRRSVVTIVHYIALNLTSCCSLLHSSPLRSSLSLLPARSPQHFESGGNRRASGGSKIEAFTGGSNGFGDKSSKDNGGGMFPELLGAEVTGGLSLAQLEEHNKRMDREEGKEEEWKHNEGSHGRHGDSDSDSDSNDDMRST